MASLRIALIYLWRHHRLPDMISPTRLTELVQVRKLRDRDRRWAPLADKLLVKDIVAERIGREWVIPTLWHGTSLPRDAPWPRPFVVKARHGCNQCAFIRSGTEDWQAVRQAATRWQRQTYGLWLDEWLYRQIPHGLLVETFIGVGQALPIDYKFFVFGGRVEFVQVHIDREFDHRWIVFDRNWRRVSSQTADADPSPPSTLGQMIEAAEELGRQIDFVRVDLYEAGGKPLFGEMTFYPGSGLEPVDPARLDRLMGAHWLRARARQARRRQAMPALVFGEISTMAYKTT